MAVNSGTIKTSNIYIERPNQHLLVKEDCFILRGEPEENRFRPSIDVFFDSAAVSYSSHITTLKKILFDLQNRVPA